MRVVSQGAKSLFPGQEDEGEHNFKVIPKLDGCCFEEIACLTGLGSWCRRMRSSGSALVPMVEIAWTNVDPWMTRMTRSPALPPRGPTG